MIRALKTTSYTKGPSINYVVSVGGGGEEGQKLPILCCKKTTKRGEGVKKGQFGDDIVYGRPLSENSNYGRERCKGKTLLDVVNNSIRCTRANAFPDV